MSNQRSINALLARGLDSDKAKSLIAKNYTLQKIKTENDQRLYEFGLSEKDVKLLKKSVNRPPVPSDTLKDLLMDSAFTCNVCRDNELPIIVHHIDSWADSNSHHSDNLIVLCLNCHSKAHSQSSIATNLDKSRLKSFKKSWLEKVKSREIESVFRPPTWGIDEGVWDYLNHCRIIDLAKLNKVELHSIDGYQDLLTSNLIAKDGSYIWPSGNQLDPNKMHFMYEGGFVSPLRSLIAFYIEILKSILKKTNLKIISNDFRKSAVNALTNNNSVLAVTGGHRFKCLTPKELKGPGQRRKGYRKGRGLHVDFEIDAWETTSSSSHWTHLSGVWTCTSILLVRNISKNDKQVKVHCTCLAIGTGFTDYFPATPSIASMHEEYDEFDDHEEYGL